MVKRENAIVCLPLLAIGLVIAASPFSSAGKATTQAAGKEGAHPLWNGEEKIEEYAKRTNLQPSRSVDLGSGVKLDLVLVPAGEFIMGEPEASLESEQATLKKSAADRQRPGLLAMPQHPVRLTKPLYMSKFVITQDQYQAVTGTNPSKLKGKDKPVNLVDWDDAQAFCKRLGEQLKQTVRLPTEAEWEFSCRGGTKTEYYSGDADADLDRVGWYAGNSKGTLHPVGQKEPNAFGLYDMHGNIGQWCVDRYADDTYSKSVVEDPQGPEHGTLHAMRGGSWGTPAWMCRSGVTFGAEVDDRSVGIGIRIVLPMPTAP